jgi:predicted nucleic acid-binding protein
MKLPFGDSYVVDNNVLITLMAHHPQDKPAYRAIWDEIDSLIKQKKIFSTMVVYEEIMRYLGKDDRLKKWAVSHKKRFFISPDEETWQLAQGIAKKFPDLLDKKKLQTGEPDADPFLIALAKAEGATIITQERKDLTEYQWLLRIIRLNL